MSPPPLLRLDRVGRRFGGLTALHDVSVDITAGTRHAVIGPNGAGKTTLVNLVAGSLRPTGGTIVFDGRDITRLPAPARARHGIGRTWQHPAVFGRLTVTANLTLALTHGRDRTARSALLHRGTLHARAAQLVDDAGLTDHATIPAGRLPYGLQRRLELAMALAARPWLLLLDEPSAGLDPAETTRLTQLITTLTPDITVLLVDHNLDLIWSAADTVTVLHHGRHLATGGPDQIRADPQVQDAYLATGDPPPSPRRRDRSRAGPALLRVRDLRAGYHGAPVLHGVDLDVGEGEAVAVLGRNGAGKTTLLNAIAGLLPPKPGSNVELAGRPLSGRRPHHPARAGLTLVPQGRRLFGPLTVTEHLTCAHAAHRGAPRATAGRAWTIDRVLALLPALAARLHHPAQRLSGGEQQMLALARALLTNPRLLVLDEPSEGLAPAVIGQLTATLATLTADGLAVLIAEQHLALAAAITDRVVVLHHGRIAMTCPTHQLSEPAHRHRLHAMLGVAEPTPEPHAEVQP
jgi:ABC-type branched-subunit amino acid transport system ATPase component